MKPIHKHAHFPISNQKGAALIISLLILLVMTLIGVSSIQNTSMEEKMVGNMHDRNRSFQAAEIALRDAEQKEIENNINLETPDDVTAKFDNTGGFYSLTPQSEPDPFTVPWDDTNSIAASFSTLKGVNTVPRYRLKVAGIIEDKKEALNIKGYAKKAPALDVYVFNVTGRGTGGSDQSQTILRSRYGKEIN